jgi:hypothetical protein
MKKLITLLSCTVLLCGAVIGCKSPKLELGGAYAPVGPDGVARIAPDVGFFAVEASFKLAHNAIRTVFDFEMENEAMLWRISPEIKRTLDKVRPQVNDAILVYARARDAYLASPTPAGLSNLEFALAKVKQLALAAEAAVPKQ